MLHIVVAPENWLFSSALCLMLLIGVVELLGLGTIGTDVGGMDADHPMIGWASTGPLPLSIALILFLGLFSLTGFFAQQVASVWIGGRLPAVPAAALALLIAAPGTRLLGGALAKVLPADETTAVSLDTLVGRRGRIVLGTASAGRPARAKVRDAHGHGHYVLVEPHVADIALGEGDEILLIAREAGAFLAVAVDPHVTIAQGEAA